MFGKKFSKKHIFATYNNYIKYCEKIVFFIENNEDKKHILIEMANKLNKEIIICYNSSYGTKLVKMTSIEKFGERYRISNFYTSNDIERLIAWKPIHIPE